MNIDLLSCLIRPTSNSTVEFIFLGFISDLKRYLFLCYTFEILNSDKIKILRGGGE